MLLALSGSETVEQAEALSKLVREGLGSDAVVLPEQASPALDAFRAPLSSIGKAERVIVIGDDPVEARAPVVALWIKAARRNGAEILTVGCRGHPSDRAWRRGRSRPRRSASRSKRRGADLVGPGRRRRRDRRGAGAGARRGLGLLPPRHPERPRGRRGLGRGRAAAAGEDRHAAHLRRRCRRRPARPRARRAAPTPSIAIAMFADPLREWVDLVLPATSYLERDGTMVNLEGRAQRLRRTVIPPAPDEVAWIAKLAERFGVAIDPHARHDADGQMPERAAAGPTRRPAGAARPTTAHGGPLKLVRYRALFSGPGGRARRGAPVPAARRRDRALARTTPRSATSSTGERRRRPLERHLGAACAPASTGSSSHGAVRAPEEHVRDARPGRRGEQAVNNGEPWWIGADQGR